MQGRAVIAPSVPATTQSEGYAEESADAYSDALPLDGQTVAPTAKGLVVLGALAVLGFIMLKKG